jgi:hypothetical protein
MVHRSGLYGIIAPVHSAELVDGVFIYHYAKTIPVPQLLYKKNEFQFQLKNVRLNTVELCCSKMNGTGYRY